MTEIVLLRHGETEWDQENRLHGHAPVPLTQTGRESVETVGHRLATTYDFDHLYAADTLAARETAALVRLAGVTPRPQLEPAWRPRDAGVFQGLAYEELELSEEETDTTDVDALQSLPRGGEGLTDARERVLNRLKQLCSSSGEDEQVLIVTHDFPIATILADIVNADPVNGLDQYAPGDCSVTTIRLTTQELTVRKDNVTHRQFVNG